MNDMSRIGGASPTITVSQSVPVQRKWWSRSWFVNMAFGFISAAVAMFIIGTGIETVNGKLLLIGSVCWGIGHFGSEYFILKKFISGFEEKGLLQIIGGIPALLIMIPLTVTPSCGWNNDQCRPVHHQIHHAK